MDDHHPLTRPSHSTFKDMNSGDTDTVLHENTFSVDDTSVPIHASDNITDVYRNNNNDPFGFHRRHDNRVQQMPHQHALHQPLQQVESPKSQQPLQSNLEAQQQSVQEPPQKQNEKSDQQNTMQQRQKQNQQRPRQQHLASHQELSPETDSSSMNFQSSFNIHKLTKPMAPAIAETARGTIRKQNLFYNGNSINDKNHNDANPDIRNNPNDFLLCINSHERADHEDHRCDDDHNDNEAYNGVVVDNDNLMLIMNDQADSIQVMMGNVHRHLPDANRSDIITAGTTPTDNTCTSGSTRISQASPPTKMQNVKSLHNNSNQSFRETFETSQMETSSATAAPIANRKLFSSPSSKISGAASTTTASMPTMPSSQFFNKYSVYFNGSQNNASATTPKSDTISMLTATPEQHHNVEDQEQDFLDDEVRLKDHEGERSGGDDKVQKTREQWDRQLLPTFENSTAHSLSSWSVQSQQCLPNSHMQRELQLQVQLQEQTATRAVPDQYGAVSHADTCNSSSDDSDSNDHCKYDDNVDNLKRKSNVTNIDNSNNRQDGSLGSTNTAKMTYQQIIATLQHNQGQLENQYEQDRTNWQSQLKRLQALYWQEQQKVLQVQQELLAQQDATQEQYYYQQQEQQKAMQLWKQKQQRKLHKQTIQQQQQLQQQHEQQKNQLNLMQKRLEQQQHIFEKNLEKFAQKEADLKAKAAGLLEVEASLQNQKDEIEQHEANYKSERIKIEESYQELLSKRKREEQKLQELLSKTEELIVKKKSMENDLRILRETYEEKCLNGKAENEELQQQIKQNRDELDGIKQRLQLFVVEDRICRQAAKNEAENMSQELKQTEKQLNNARLEKEKIDKNIVEQTKIHGQLIQSIQNHKDEEHQLIEKKAQLNLDIRDALIQAKKGISEYEIASKQKQELILDKLKVKSNQMERMYEHLVKLYQKFQLEWKLLSEQKMNLSSKQEQLESVLGHLQRKDEHHQNLEKDLGEEIFVLQNKLHDEEMRHQILEEGLQLQISKLRVELNEHILRHRNRLDSEANSFLGGLSYLEKQHNEELDKSTPIDQQIQEEHNKQKYEWTNRLEQLEEERLKLSQECDEVKIELNLVREERDQLQRERDQNKSELKDLTCQCQQQIYTITNEKKRLQEQLVTKQEYERDQNFESIKKENKALQKCLASLRKQLQGQLDSILNENTTLKGKLSRPCKERPDHQDKDRALPLPKEKMKTLEESLAHASSQLQPLSSQLEMDQERDGDAESQLVKNRSSWETQPSIDLGLAGKGREVMGSLKHRRSKLDNRLTDNEYKEKAFAQADQAVKDCWKEIREMECELSVRLMHLERKSKEIKNETLQNLRNLQKIALRNLLKRPWREDRELVSAVFSKWVRESVFEIADKSNSKYDKGLELDQARRHLEEREKELIDCQNGLIQSKRELQSQIKVNERSKVILEDEISKFNEEEKTILHRLDLEKHETAKERGLLEKEREELNLLGKHLREREQRIENEVFRKNKSQTNGTSSDTPYSLSLLSPSNSSRGILFADVDGELHNPHHHLSRALEETLDEERNLMEETALLVAQRENEIEKRESELRGWECELKEKELQLKKRMKEIQSGQNRIRIMTNQLHQKEKVLRDQENQLEEAWDKYKFALAKVQHMAIQLQNKQKNLSSEENNLTKRIQECDQLEMQLSHWERQLLFQAKGDEGEGNEEEGS